MYRHIRQLNKDHKKNYGIVPCGGRKKSPRTSPIVQIILHTSFGPLRSVRMFRVLKVQRLEPSSKQCLNNLATFRHVSLIKTSLCKFLKLQFQYPKLRNRVHTTCTSL